MGETGVPVVPIRPGLTARYSDVQALNDIHALLTAPGLSAGEIAASAAEIVARTGRRVDPARVITAEVAEDGHGMPVARVDADGTIALVSQDPDGPGVLIQVTTRDPAEAARLAITVDSRAVGRSPAHRARPGRSHQSLPARPARRDGPPPVVLDGEGGPS